jgi:hypothetical protein
MNNDIYLKYFEIMTIMLKLHLSSSNQSAEIIKDLEEKIESFVTDDDNEELYKSFNELKLKYQAKNDTL